MLKIIVANPGSIYYLRKFDSYEELEKSIDEYIDFYNTRRLQKKLKGEDYINFNKQLTVNIII